MAKNLDEKYVDLKQQLLAFVPQTKTKNMLLYLKTIYTLPKISLLTGLSQHALKDISAKKRRFVRRKTERIIRLLYNKTKDLEAKTTELRDALAKF